MPKFLARKFLLKLKAAASNRIDATLRNHVMGEPAEPHFPPEIWELIFQNCSDSELLQIRLVCHQWKNIVIGSPSLWRRLGVWFSEADILPGCVPNNLPPTTKASFFRVDTFEISFSWWPKFGLNLQDLHFKMCRTTVREMFNLLQHCPKLKRLVLVYVGFHPETPNANHDIKLDSMEELSLTYIYNSSNRAAFVNLFGPIFPRLTSLSIKDANHWNLKDIRGLSKFIQMVQYTLKILELPGRIDLLYSLADMDRLLLNRVEFGIGSNIFSRYREWSKFCQAQREMQDLIILCSEITDKDLCSAVQKIPQLKQLRVTSSNLIVPTFLNKVSGSVEKVKLIFFSLDFRTRLSSFLRKFHLIRVRIQHGIEFLMTSTGIEILTLNRCDLNSCPIPCGVEDFSVLKQLELCSCDISPEMLEFMLSHHPVLEAVTISKSPTLKIDIVVNLLWCSPKLRQVSLYCCPGLAETCGEEIMRIFFEKHNLERGSRTVRFVIEELPLETEILY